MSDGSPISGAATDAEWERLARHIAGESTPAESAQVRAWLAGDPGRMKLVEILDHGSRAPESRTPKDIDVEAALMKVRARIRKPHVITFEPRKPKTAPWQWAFRIAAAIVVVVGATELLDYRSGPGPGAPVQRVATQVGQRARFGLGDGSTVTLGAASTLNISPDYNTGVRSVSLTGEAYFDVRHDPAHPFVVHVAGVAIRDVGTSFGVSQANGRVGVAVASGSVAISMSVGGTHPETIVIAGSSASVTQNGIAVTHEPGAAQDALAWTQGRLVFRDASLAAVSVEIYRWYGVRLQTGDPAFSGRHITASFSGEPVDQVLRVIALTLGARIERQGDLAILRAGASPAVRR